MENSHLQGQGLPNLAVGPMSPLQLQGQHPQALQEQALLQQQQQQMPQPPANSPEAQLAYLQATMNAVLNDQQRLQQQAQDQIQRQATLEQQLAAKDQQIAALQAAMAHQAAQPPVQGAGLDLAVLTQAQAAAKLVKELDKFAGRASASGASAERWLADAEYIFRNNEAMLGTTGTSGADKMRVRTACAALTDDARLWHQSLLDAGQAPESWQTFKAAFQAQFNKINSNWSNHLELQTWVEKWDGKIHNVDQLSDYNRSFVQRAGRISDTFLPRHLKLALYARGLPRNMRKWVLDHKVQQDWDSAKTVSEVAQDVLDKACTDMFARNGLRGLGGGASFAGAASSSSSAAAEAMEDVPVEVNAMRAVGEDDSAFGGEAEDETSRPRLGGNAAVQLNAIANQLTLAVNALSSHANRTALAKGFVKQIPKELEEARKKAGLCMRCGKVWFTRGKEGHNGRTCKAPIDKLTGAAEGQRAAEAAGPKPARPSFQ